MTPEQATLIEAQTRLANRQAFWEGAKALAMILLAVAALSATMHIIDRLEPPRTQTITVHLDAPFGVLK